MIWLDMSLLEIQDDFEQLNFPKFRAKQFYSWLIKGADFDEMLNIPKKLRERLQDRRPLGLPNIIKQKKSALDDTMKFLFELYDGHIIEGVLMRYKHGNTLCISSQVGCRMGCQFCASAIGGLLRNLSSGEMLGEVLAVERYERKNGRAPKNGRAVHNVVLMGSGEPMDNYDQLIHFLNALNDKQGVNMSLRNVSVSTCGIAPNMISLANDAPGVNLSLSLHAPEDKLRQSMMPIANHYNVDQLMHAAREFVRISGRRIIIEYALLSDKNDSDIQSEQLAKLLRGLQCHVNVIPLNQVKECTWRSSGRATAYEFVKKLEAHGLSATVRREMGTDIEGACGQLRAGYLKEQVEADQLS